MNTAELLIIVELPENKKVLCQAEGCGHSVYKRVHVIRELDKLSVYGEDCAKKRFGKTLRKPVISKKKLDGYVLSERDIEQLLENTQLFIDDMQTRFEEKTPVEMPIEPDFSKMPDKALKQYCLEKVKEQFRKEKGLDPELPGWAGWVNSDASALFKNGKAAWLRIHKTVSGRPSYDGLEPMPSNFDNKPTLESNHCVNTNDCIAHDLAILVTRLCYTLKQSDPDNELAQSAMDYLKRKGLLGSPMRDSLKTGGSDNP